mmetsp:Transcript_15908/g.32027  ORF Transcript_15908/g.32027 Transcript_15908/m.32027 type:complete len:231 (-) Transcript_15908:464-1156(-)|eukprot:CAMPEP_0178545458 /NCGR_PEP_ID=MMETSP0697-20121206/3646_1 /TAXON_ID=265572 /ORGANISM="Extubocellulus spinifer, Strain CCMP396" /LENGTH=230 /DNA_ID=CAMNT_0020178013 /DNA_START=16 /DNA_END=708 /DNA_ORIENTATION=+
MKIIAFTLIAGASAFSPAASSRRSTALHNGPVAGAGGMFDTRDPDAFVHEDPRKSISVAPSFEEYLKQRSGGTAAAPPAAAAAVPAPPEPVLQVPEKKELPVGFGGCTKTSNVDGLKSHHPRSDVVRPRSYAPSTPEQIRSGVANTRAATPAQARHFSSGSGTILDDSKPYSYLGTKSKTELPIGFGGSTKTSNVDGLTSHHPRSDVYRPKSSEESRFDYNPTTSDPHAY